MKKKDQHTERAPWEEEEKPGKKTPGNSLISKEDAGEDDEDEDEEEGDAGEESEDNDGGTTAVKKAAKGAKKAAVKHRWQPRLSYRWIMGNVGFFLFLAALAVIYIYNGHYADKTVRDISRTNKELKELQYEYKTLRSEVMFRSKQSELAKAVEPFGLKELVQPPVIVGDSATVSR